MICRYFLPFGRFPFHFIGSFFGAQRIFSLIESYLFVFAFVALTFVVQLKTSLPKLVSRSLPTIFSPRSFKVSVLEPFLKDKG